MEFAGHIVIHRAQFVIQTTMGQPSTNVRNGATQRAAAPGSPGMRTTNIVDYMISYICIQHPMSYQQNGLVDSSASKKKEPLEGKRVLILTMGLRMNMVTAALFTRTIDVGAVLSMTVTSIPGKCAVNAEEARSLNRLLRRRLKHRIWTMCMNWTRLHQMNKYLSLYCTY